MLRLIGIGFCLHATSQRTIFHLRHICEMEADRGQKENGNLQIKITDLTSEVFGGCSDLRGH